MKTHPCRVLTVIFIALGACQRSDVPRSPVQSSRAAVEGEEFPEYRDILKEGVVARIPASDFVNSEFHAVMISEAYYLSIRDGFQQSAKAETRQGSAHLAAAASNRATLGVLATSNEGEWESDLLVVAPDIHVEEEGVLGTRDFYLVAGRFSGAGRFGSDPELALKEETLAQGVCEKLGRGCRAVVSSGAIHWLATGEDETAGLGPDIVMNLESDESVAETNASLRIPALRVLYRAQTELLGENVFKCQGLVSVLYCADAEFPDAVEIYGTVQTLNLTSTAGPIVVLREADFLRLVAEDALHDEYAPNEDAVRIATLGNQPSMLGLSSTLVTDGELFESVITIVVRDFAKDRDGRGVGREWYVVPGYLKGSAPVYGVAPRAHLETVFERFTTLNGPCGTVSFPRESPACDWGGPCIPLTVSTYNDPRFGAARWQQSRPRTTIRFPTPKYPTRPYASYACSEFQPPPRPIPGEGECGRLSEECNGIDDNCNGAADEGDVCESRCAP